ncbi:MAG: hypothetical protein M5U07_00830 [Xanthobacteraceae bacterium]|nr:hypothetical protein [Xanthobacteraceae bacterium]
MRVFVWSLTGLLIGLVAGYVLVLGGGLAPMRSWSSWSIPAAARSWACC